MTNVLDHVEVDQTDTIVFKQLGIPNQIVEQGKMTLNSNMVFQQLSGRIEFRTVTNKEWQTYSPLIARIVPNIPYELSGFMVNGKSLEEIIQMYGGNPIYGKKIAVIGDSEINGAYECNMETTYPNYIVQRNNMMMFQTCCSKLAMPRYTNQDPSQGITYPSLVGNFRSLIPGEVDIIWIHNGYNDAFDADTPDDELLSAGEAQMTDEQCRVVNVSDPTWTRSYKRSFNTVMVSLTNEYRNAKIAVSLPYNWDGGRTAINNFIKARCKVYGIEVIDGSSESGFTLDDTQYFTIRPDGTLKDHVHLSKLGSKRISWMFERFMKTRMQVSPHLTPQPTFE